MKYVLVIYERKKRKETLSWVNAIKKILLAK